MSKKDKEWQEEQRRVDLVVGKVKEKQAELEKESGIVQEEIVNIRRNFWEDVTVNLEDDSEAIETAASMRQQAEVLSERERRYRHAKKKWEVLSKLGNSPYFGRIDFQEEGEPELEKIYLGVASFYDEENDEFLVYDWRAPISSLYYDFPPGPAEYHTPSGTIRGTLDRKRQFVIRKGKIEGLFDTGVTIGDELLQEILGKQADANMKSIVATIQREQNQIIRNDRSKLIIVQGVAGSGKTSAALQRVAYLLYRYRGHLTADQIVLFSPNTMFNSYVSSVLPELGEENMQQTTFQEYLERELGKRFHLEDPFDQMEFVLGNSEVDGYEARREGIRFKSSQDYFDLLERYLEMLAHEGMVFRNIRFRGKTFISKEELQEYFYSLDQGIKIPDRLQLTKQYILERLDQLEIEERKQSWVDDEIENLDEEVYNKIHRRLQKRKRYTENTFNDYDRQRYALAQIVVRKYMKPLRKRVGRLLFVNLNAIYRQLFDGSFEHLFAGVDLPERWKEICHQTLSKMDQRGIFYEDATPFLYLKERLEGFRTNNSIRHLFIDEAQDYSPFQFAFLRRLFPRSKMTVLGDFNQSIYAHAETVKDPFSPLHALFASDEIDRYDLLKSYRSTKEIMDFARQMVEGGEKITPFERHGAKPTLTIREKKEDRVREIAERIRLLQADNRESIAVLCKTESESIAIHQALVNQWEIEAQHIHKNSATFDKGVIVIPSYLAKGIEFDAVLIADASQYQEEWERKLFYTSCTRSMHELHLFAADDSNPFLKEVSKESYLIRE